MLNQTQKACCVQHMRTIYPLIREADIPFSNLDPADELMLVGVAPYAEPVSYGSVEIASSDSLLGNAHKAYLKTLVDVTDTTQYVKEAGEVKLNPQEHQKRLEVYRCAVMRLANTLRFTGDTGGIGYPLEAVDTGSLPSRYEFT